MSGPEHYAAAERLLEQVMLRDPANAPHPAYAALLTAAAQAHATLALAAAVWDRPHIVKDDHVLTPTQDLPETPGQKAWDEVTA